MTIPARYSGVCPECGERWRPGDLIRADALDDIGHAVWAHAACPDVIDPTALHKGEKACPDC